MTKRAFLELYADRGIRRVITAESWRRFGTVEDRQDAAAEAWERLWGAPTGRSYAWYQDEARRAILAMHQRQYVRRHRQAQILAMVALFPALRPLLHHNK